MEESNTPMQAHETKTEIEIHDYLTSILANAQIISDKIIDNARISSFNIFKFNLANFSHENKSIRAIKFYLLTYQEESWQKTWRCIAQLSTANTKEYLEIIVNNRNDYDDLYNFFYKYANRDESPDINEKSLLSKESWKELKIYNRDNTLEIYHWTLDNKHPAMP